MSAPTLLEGLPRITEAVWQLVVDVTDADAATYPSQITALIGSDVNIYTG